MVDYKEKLFINGDICVVAFAGDSQKEFEFGNLLSTCGVSYVLFRDSNTKWYQNGVAGIGDRAETVKYIWRLKEEYYVKTIGVSNGAYGALFYGQLAGVDEVIAISPVTGKEADDFDPKWHSRILPLPGYVDPSPCEDLRRHYRDGAIPYCRAFVSDGDGTELDYQMAARIGLTDITVIPGFGHSALAKHMRDTGMLERLIKEKVRNVR